MRLGSWVSFCYIRPAGLEKCDRNATASKGLHTERRDADFVRERPEKAAGKSEVVQRMILSVLSESPERKMESVALKNEVIAQIGCSGSTYDHARSALTKDGLIRNEKQGKGYTTLNQDRVTVRVA